MQTDNTEQWDGILNASFLGDPMLMFFSSNGPQLETNFKGIFYVDEALNSLA